VQQSLSLGDLTTSREFGLLILYHIHRGQRKKKVHLNMQVGSMRTPRSCRPTPRILAGGKLVLLASAYAAADRSRIADLGVAHLHGNERAKEEGRNSPEVGESYQKLLVAAEVQDSSWAIVLPFSRLASPALQLFRVRLCIGS
jgi:hypothetical protein